MSMNRRSFFGKVAAAAAVPALVKVASAEHGVAASVIGQPDPPVALILPDGSIQSQRPELTIERRNLAHTHTPPPVGTHTHDLDPGPGLTHAIPLPKPFWEDRLTLLQRRGLMAPCPHCNTVDWGSWLCLSCGWRDDVNKFAQPCPCHECSDLRPLHSDGYAKEAVDITLARLEHASPGLYRIVEIDWTLGPRPVERRSLNVYDVTRDAWLHHGVEQQYARVRCAVSLFRTSRDMNPAGVEQNYRRANGDQVLLGWHMVDCYEWRVERGEKPPIVYHRDADGRTTLVQGVV